MLSQFTDFIPAKLHDCNPENWYISYYVKNPANNKLERKQIRLNRINPASTRLKFARKLINEINCKLNDGWNPFIEQEASKSFHRLSDAMQLFMQVKFKELRPDSIRCYKSYIKFLNEYLTNILKNTDIYVINFDANKATELMQYLYSKPATSERLFNNYKSFYITFWNWLIENQYCKANVFLHIKKKREKEKVRKYIDTQTRKLIKDYLLKTNQKEFYITCLLCYNCLIRPKEMLMLKSEHIKLEKGIINIPGEISKTHKTRCVTITDELYDLLSGLNLDKINPEYYIFSTGLKPGKLLKKSNYLGKFWNRMRNKLGLPKHFQFYSLKDSGITDLLKSGVKSMDVKQQAGHSSLAMTEKYVQDIDRENANVNILHNNTKF